MHFLWPPPERPDLLGRREIERMNKYTSKIRTENVLETKSFQEFRNYQHKYQAHAHNQDCAFSTSSDDLRTNSNRPMQYYMKSWWYEYNSVAKHLLLITSEWNEIRLRVWVRIIEIAKIMVANGDKMHFWMVSGKDKWMMMVVSTAREIMRPAFITS